MKKLICTMAALALLGSAALAAPGSYTASAALRPDITVRIDGVTRTFYNAQGEEMQPISYADSTYVPIRSIGELMGKNVNWDGTTYTATIGGTRVTEDVTGTPDDSAVVQAITLSIEPGITIVIDGTARTFYDEQGSKVEPVLYEGSIYLPIRAIDEIMGKTVSWDEATQTVYLTTPVAGGEVTDFDTNNPSGGSTGTTTGAVTLEQARQIALEHAGRTAAEVTFVKARSDWDDGRQVYEVEFLYRSGTGYLEYDYDAEGYTSSGSQTVSITEAEAKQIALAKVPGAGTANVYACKLDYDDGRWEYEGKILYNGMEYEFTIDASTGTITEWDAESIYD